MAYPEGTVPTTEEVHPTPIYETVSVGLIAYLLWRLRDRVTTGMLFALYLVLTGTERLLIEFIRRNDDVALGLTQPQLISIAMIAFGAVWILIRARRDEFLAPRPA
jgi:phosphatidylglycerol:prolipoprotein diacylglycerol transferase